MLSANAADPTFGALYVREVFGKFCSVWSNVASHSSCVYVGVIAYMLIAYGLLKIERCKHKVPLNM